jgi:small subunit ribosomal protein S21
LQHLKKAVSLQPIRKLIINQDMLIVPVKEGENIERALKKYKKKYDKTNVMKELRSRKEFIKPSVINRQQRIKAAYREKMISAEL